MKNTKIVRIVDSLTGEVLAKWKYPSMAHTSDFQNQITDNDVKLRYKHHSSHWDFQYQDEFNTFHSITPELLGLFLY